MPCAKAKAGDGAPTLSTVNDNVDAEAGGPLASSELPLRPRVTEDGGESSYEGSVENAGEAGDEIIKQDNLYLTMRPE